MVLTERAGDDPFDRVDGWRLGGARASWRRRLTVNGGQPVELAVDRAAGGMQIDADDQRHVAAVERTGEHTYWLSASLQ